MKLHLTAMPFVFFTKPYGPYLDVMKFTGEASAPEKPSPQHLAVQLE